MLANISDALLGDIINLLEQLPLDKVGERRAFIQSVDLGEHGPALRAKIDLSSQKDVFCAHLVNEFNAFGMVTSSDHVLYRLLQAVRKDVGVDRRQVIDSLMKRIRREISAHGISSGPLMPEGEPCMKDELDFPFANREDEIREILSSLAPPYFVIDAPAGYGKTHLLKELRKRFREQGWACGYAFIERHHSLGMLAQELARDLGMDASAIFGSTGRQLGAALAAHIMRMPPEGFHKRGLVILIDLEHGIPEQVVQELTMGVIPGIQERLRDLQLFDSQANRFRVTLAGRYLALMIPKSFPKSDIVLTPFTYEVVRNAAHNYLRSVGMQVSQARVAKLSAHVIFLTGGHPQCIAQALVRYCISGYSPDGFFDNVGEEIRDYVLEVTDRVQRDVPQDMLDVLKYICVYRHLDVRILRTLIQEGHPPFGGLTDAHELADRLTQTYLITRRHRLLQDDITRRLLAIRLRHDIGPQQFAERCQQAETIYEECVRQGSYMPERWTIEYLFQSLQQHADRARDCSVRKDLRRSFFDKKVPLILKCLIEGRDPREEVSALVGALGEDWEFRFNVNYFLRGKEYTNEPYQTLLALIWKLAQ